MMQEISELVKRHQNTLGRIVLILGSGVPLRPERLSSGERLHQALREYARDMDPSLPEEPTLEQVHAVTEARDPAPAEAAKYVAPRFRDIQPSEGHLRLARLVNEGYFPTIFTLGIDDLLERALAQAHLHPDEQYNLVNVGLATRREIAGAVADSRRVTLVKALGTVGSSAFAFTRRQIQSYLRRIQRFLFDASTATTFIVGYSEADSDLIGCLKPEGGPLYWVNPRYPLGTAAEFDQLKLEAPDSVEHHVLWPNVLSLIKSRKSERLILTRESGRFDTFFRDLYDRRVRRSRDYAIREPRARDSLALDPEGPYKLVEPMELRDSTIFHGRDDQLAAVEASLENSRIALIFGEPGIGKTSFVQAGLARNLSDEGALAAVFRVGTDPRREAIQALRRAHADTGSEETAAVPDDLTVRQEARTAYEETGSQVILIIDQGDELLSRLGPVTLREFGQQLADFLDDEEIGARLVITVSERGLALLHDLTESLPDLYQNLHRLTLLNPSQARHCIVRPAAKFERRWEEDLVERLLDELGPDRIHPTRMEIVCYSCYATLGRARVVTERAYEALGGQERILTNFLKETLNTLGWRDREAARQVLRALVRSSQMKAPLSFGQVLARCPRLDRDRVERLLWALADARLVRRLGREKARSYEVTSNWLVPRISEGMSADDLAHRELEDEIARRLTDWRLHGVPLDVATLRRAEGFRGRLKLTKEELSFVIISSARQNEGFEDWLQEGTRLGDEEIATLETILHTCPDEARLQAAARLDDIGSDAAVRVLVDSLGELEGKVQRKVAEYLEGRGETVAAAVRETHGRDRAKALAALTSVGSPDVVDPLLEVVDDASEDAEVREVAVSALTTVAPKTGRRASASLTARLANQEGPKIDEERARALARVAVAEGEQDAVFKAANAHPKALSLRYAAALAAADLRDIEEAEAHLEALRAGAPTGGDDAEVGALGQRLAELRRRLDAGHFEWTMFRKDPAHSAIAWQDGPSKTPRALWRAATQGQVVGSSCVSKGEAFFGAKDGVLRAVESKTGREIWSRRLGLSIESTPACTDDLIIVGCLDHRVYACDRETGRVQWRYETDGEVRSAPTVVGDNLLIGSWDGHLYNLDLHGGGLRWRAPAGGPIYACPACKDDRVFIGSWAGRILCVDLESGNEVFSVAAGDEVHSSATITDDGRVIVGSDASEVLVFGVDSPEIQLRYSTDGPVRSSPACVQGRVYAGASDGRLHCFDVQSGEPYFTFRVQEPLVGSPALTPNQVIFGSSDGNLYCVQRDSGEEIFRVESSYSIVSSPAVVDGVIYVGMEYYELHALGEATEGA
jgi:outer membrane protein assembly factor BamB